MIRAEQLYKHLASGWEKAFQRRMPTMLQSFTRNATALLKQFHAVVEKRSHEKGHGLARLGLLSNQLKTYQAIFGDLATATITIINTARDQSRVHASHCCGYGAVLRSLLI